MSHSTCKGACSQFGAFESVYMNEAEITDKIESALGHDHSGLEIIYNKDGKRAVNPGFPSNKAIYLMYKSASSS